MKFRPRLDRLELTRKLQTDRYPDARAELLRRLERADPETKARVLTAIREMRKRDA